MRIVIGEGSCGIAAGAQKVRTALEALISEPIGSTGCIGMCYLEPIVDLYEGKELLRRLEGLQQALGVLAHAGRFIPRAGRLGSQLLGCILQFHFRHSTLAPPL